MKPTRLVLQLAVRSLLPLGLILLPTAGRAAVEESAPLRFDSAVQPVDDGVDAGATMDLLVPGSAVDQEQVAIALESSNISGHESASAEFSASTDFSVADFSVVDFSASTDFLADFSVSTVSTSNISASAATNAEGVVDRSVNAVEPLETGTAGEAIETVEVIETVETVKSVETAEDEPTNPEATGTADPDIADSDTIDSDAIDSDATDPDIADSDTIDSDTIDSDATDSDTIDSDTIDSDATDSDTIDSDTIDPDATDPDTAEPVPVEPAADKKPGAEDEAVVELDPAEQQRQQLLMQADTLYLAGDIAAAEKLYRQAKDPQWKERVATLQRPEPILDPANLPPAGQVYWREALAGREAGLETRTLIPLELLVEEHPAFIPGYIQLAEVLQQYDRAEEALIVLERGATLYPNQPDLSRVRAIALAQQEEWMEASIAARQFALLNPDHPESKKFVALANEYLDEFESDMRAELRGNAIANVITGVVGFALTGNIFGPLSGLDSTLLLLRGEETVGRQVAERIRSRLPMMEDETVLAYVNDVGQRLAQVTGRDEFDYEFYVVMDDRLNAFALPGGKVFVNAGAILETRSEAELAGLLAHELAHAVLSHGFQRVTEGNLTANLTQYLPFGGTLADLLILDYSRDMERQSDVMGTQILASAGYAADGLHNLMVTLYEQEEARPAFSWLSTHPLTEERVDYTAALIQERGLNRYRYEGVEQHLQIQARVRDLMEAHEAEQDAEEPEME